VVERQLALELEEERAPLGQIVEEPVLRLQDGPPPRLPGGEVVQPAPATGVVGRQVDLAFEAQDAALDVEPG